MQRLKLAPLLVLVACPAADHPDASNDEGDATGTHGDTAVADDTGADPDTGGEGSSGGPDLAELYACEEPELTILFPFGGPGFDSMTGELVEPIADEYVVSTTQLLPKADAASQQAFFELTEAVVVELMQTPGLLGAGFAQEPNCGFMRTLTVWESEQAMFAFVSSDAHVEAMSQTFVVGVTGRVTSWTAPADEMPPSWEGAIAKIAEVDPLDGY
jgi:hypothetical protein